MESEFWYTLVGIVAAVIAYPFLRCFVKRIICVGKLKRLCQRKHYTLHKAHFLWFLGRKHGKYCDFHIETKHEILSLKFFGVPYRRTALVLKEDGTYFVRTYFALPFNRIPLDGKPHPLPPYRFRHAYKSEWELKTPHSILLIHPTAMEIRCRKHRTETIFGGGDIASGMEIQTLPRLLGYLENAL